MASSSKGLDNTKPPSGTLKQSDELPRKQARTAKSIPLRKPRLQRSTSGSSTSGRPISKFRAAPISESRGTLLGATSEQSNKQVQRNAPVSRETPFVDLVASGQNTGEIEIDVQHDTSSEEQSYESRNVQALQLFRNTGSSDPFACLPTDLPLNLVRPRLSNSEC